MKKFTSAITMMMLAIAALSLTSCEDEAIAQDLAGNDGRIWEGTISKYYYDRWGFADDHYRTVIEFVGDPWHWTKGTGYEVDYDIYDPRGSYWYSEFDWRVDRGVIELRYADTGYAPVYISDYTLSDNYFIGYMDDGTGSDIRFDLRLRTDFEWDYYNIYRYDDHFSHPSRKMPATENAEGEKVKFASKGAFAKKAEATEE